MEIVKLPVGQEAAVDGDSIAIELSPGGAFFLTGSLLDGDESIAIIEGQAYPSIESAEQAGIAWAAEHNVRRLTVSVIPAKP